MRQSLGGLPRNNVVRVTDRARNDLNMLKGRKTVITPNQINLDFALDCDIVLN